MARLRTAISNIQTTVVSPSDAAAEAHKFKLVPRRLAGSSAPTARPSAEPVAEAPLPEIQTLLGKHAALLGEVTEHVKVGSARYRSARHRTAFNS